MRHADFRRSDVLQLDARLFTKTQRRIDGALCDVATRIFFQPPGVGDMPACEIVGSLGDVHALHAAGGNYAVDVAQWAVDGVEIGFKAAQRKLGRHYARLRCGAAMQWFGVRAKVAGDATGV